jgi:hypothetical protein
MDVDKKVWFLLLDCGSNLEKNWGAYKLKSIKNLGEMKMLPL